MRSSSARARSPVAAVERTGVGSNAAYAALQRDGGIRSLLESSMGFAGNVTYAAIVNREGIAVAHSLKDQEGQHMTDQEDSRRSSSRARCSCSAPSTPTARSKSGSRCCSAIRTSARSASASRRCSSSSELREALRTSLRSVLLALLISTVVAMLLAQWMLRPIHVIQSGLTRLGRGELDVRLELPEGEEFKGLGTSFEAVSAQLSAVAREGAAVGRRTDFESVVENLEDAVALFSPRRRADLLQRSAIAVALRSRRLDDMRRPTIPSDNSSSARWPHRSQGPVSVALAEEVALADTPVAERRPDLPTAGCTSIRWRARSRTPADDAPDRRCAREVRRGDARRAQPRLLEPGALDAQLLA